MTNAVSNREFFYIKAVLSLCEHGHFWYPPTLLPNTIRLNKNYFQLSILGMNQPDIRTIFYPAGCLIEHLAYIQVSGTCWISDSVPGLAGYLPDRIYSSGRKKSATQSLNAVNCR